MENTLEIKNLNKKYDGFSLKDVSFSLPKGYIMGFVGQNGSGKTTTIRSILGMTAPDSGEIKVFGMDAKADEIPIKERIGVVFDSLFFPGHLNVRQIERMMKPFYSNWSTEEYYNRIRQFELPENKAVADFSKGMKMKLMIAVAICHQADFIILDEPTSGLDPVARDELLDILAEYIQDENRSVLFSTHITADVERIADYVTVLHNGKVWFTGAKEDLQNKYVLLKGAEEDLSDDLRSKCIGFHAYRSGFDALLDAKYLDAVSDAFVTEKASIDEILVYIAKEDKHERHSQNDPV